MTFETIKFEIADHLATIRLNVPEKLNALSMDMLSEMREAVTQAQAGGARALLITGEGRGFCSGADLSDGRAMGGTPPDLKKTLDTYYHPLIKALDALEMPIVTAINGVCAGAGTGLALCGDLIVAEQTTRFNLGFVKIGLMPDAGSTWSLPRRVGLTRAMEFALLGDEISGQEALEWGLVNRAVPEGELMAVAQDLALRLAKGPTLALSLAKQAIRQAFDHSLAVQLELEGDGQKIAGRTEDFASGVMGFFTKKPPVFKGK